VIGTKELYRVAIGDKKLSLTSVVFGF